MYIILSTSLLYACILIIFYVYRKLFRSSCWSSIWILIRLIKSMLFASQFKETCVLKIRRHLVISIFRIHVCRCSFNDYFIDTCIERTIFNIFKIFVDLKSVLLFVWPKNMQYHFFVLNGMLDFMNNIFVKKT